MGAWARRINKEIQTKAINKSFKFGSISSSQSQHQMECAMSNEQWAINNEQSRMGTVSVSIDDRSPLSLSLYPVAMGMHHGWMLFAVNVWSVWKDGVRMHREYRLQSPAIFQLQWLIMSEESLGFLPMDGICSANDTENTETMAINQHLHRHSHSKNNLKLPSEVPLESIMFNLDSQKL